MQIVIFLLESLTRTCNLYQPVNFFGERNLNARTQALATVLVDNDRVRVTRFDFEPGQQTGWHVHGHDYVVTPLTACHFKLEEPEGSVREVTMQAGEAYHRPIGVEHNVINGGSEPMAFVEVEIK
jgi:quercetin dioxygenase-like cupin family protein